MLKSICVCLSKDSGQQVILMRHTLALKKNQLAISHINNYNNTLGTSSTTHTTASTCLTWAPISRKDQGPQQRLRALFGMKEIGGDGKVTASAIRPHVALSEDL